MGQYNRLKMDLLGVKKRMFSQEHPPTGYVFIV